MSGKSLPQQRWPKVRDQGANESRSITIPIGAARELNLEAGEEPADIRYDEDDRSVTFEFE